MELLAPWLEIPKTSSATRAAAMMIAELGSSHRRISRSRVVRARGGQVRTPGAPPQRAATPHAGAPPSGESATLVACPHRQRGRVNGESDPYMAVKTEGLESELIESVCGAARDRVGGHEVAPFEAFVRQYYRWVAPEDLANRSSDDLCATALAHWELAQQREPAEVKVRVFNPSEARDGFRLPFTVMDIVSDDMPFVVDSVTMELNRLGYSINLVIHPVMGVRRDDEGQLLEVLEPGGDESDVEIESILHAEVTHEDDAEQRDRLRKEIERVLSDVTAAVGDWGAMRERTQALINEFEENPPPIDRSEIDEGEELLRWLADDHFTFLGYREYELTEKGGEVGLQLVEGSGLGILRKAPKRSFTKLGPRALELARSPELLVITKANSRATVHRPAY